MFVDKRGVAQLGRVLRSGRRCRRFESCHLEKYKKSRSVERLFLYFERQREAFPLTTIAQ